MPERPKAILFDVGGVCVLSPFRAIADYERCHGIPSGWINFAIARSGRRGRRNSQRDGDGDGDGSSSANDRARARRPSDGPWQQLERGEIPLDEAFFDSFGQVLHDPEGWAEFHGDGRGGGRRRRRPDDGSGETGDKHGGRARGRNSPPPSPPLPHIDATALFWSMMAIARQLDPHMYPALLRLRAFGDGSGSGDGLAGNHIIIGALSNTVPFPPTHPFADHRVFPPPSPPSLLSSPTVPKTIQSEGVVFASSSPEASDRAAIDLRSLFDVFVASSEVGMRKPSPDIYELALARLDAWDRHRCGDGGGRGVRAADVVFVDDIGENLKTARSLGMRTVKAELGRTDKAVRELEMITGEDLGPPRTDTAKGKL